ncbi:TonB-dependent receptor [Stenotrophomonas sp. MMGLT7]|uniref:TonB-dependent receptor domain-containing protein n=1 Tax=Stenotrophomonas sp. MMGLT7 TaxID=2901227 RepID=UPI001E5776F3|nr:TonB-dependent receptor [Stenotrophomonas sp. MMGLT7]
MVTASAAGQTLREAPASITLIDREELALKPVMDLGQLLGSVEGVTLQRSGNLAPRVQLRGLDAAYTLILIDGKRVNSTSASFRGNDYDTGWVPAEMIERIEVVRGPMSSLYGSDAIGGVVNIITRRIGEAWHGSIGADYIRQQDRDAGDTRKGTFSVSGPLVAGKLGLKVYGSRDERDADGAVNDSGQAGMPYNENRSVHATVAWTPSENHDLDLGVDDSYRDHDGFEMKRQTGSLTWRGRYDFGSAEAIAYRDRTRNLTGSISGEINPNRSLLTSASGKLTLDTLERQTLTFGGEVRKEELHDPANLGGWPGSDGYGQNPDTSVQQEALFVEDEIVLHQDLRLTLGDRFDHHENFGGHHSPRAYLVWNADEAITVKAGWARAFRAPTLLQNSPNWGSVSCGSATTGCYVIGSTDLKPETSTSYELGVLIDRGRWGGGFTLFRTDLEDMIDITSRTRDTALAPSYPNFVGFLADGRPIFAYQNIARVRTQGLEANARILLGEDWSVRANYTYLDATNLSYDTPRPMVYKPEHSANVNLQWQASERIGLGLQARYVGRQYTSVYANAANNLSKRGYVLADLTSSWKLGRHLTLRAGALNLADHSVDRDNSSDYNEEGRRWYASMTASF